MDGVTVVDHVLLRRLVSILRDRTTPHGVFRQTLDDAAMILGYEAMRGLRPDEVEIETPLERARSGSRSCAWWLRPRGSRRCGRRTPRSRFCARRSTASSTATATSGRVLVTPVIGSSARIAEGERRFRLLVDANVVGVTISDDDRGLEANDAWLAIVGRTREELERGEISWRAITAPEWAAQDDQVTRKLDAEGWVAPYEKEYVRPDGTRAPVLLSGVTLDRNPLRVVAIVIDLSARYAADRERELLLSREREARREAELAADRAARLQRVTAALSAASSADEVGDVVVEQAVEAFYAAPGALAFPQGAEVAMRHDRGFEPAA